MKTSFRAAVKRLGRAIILATGLAALAPASSRAADPAAPADITVADTVLRPSDKVPPLGINGWGQLYGLEWAANNFVKNSGNEPIYWRSQHRIVACGPKWFEIDGPGANWYDLWADGFLSGADVRIYRIVDKAGQPLPLNSDGKYLDLANADHVVLVGKTQVIPEGDPEFPNGGWTANKDGDASPTASAKPAPRVHLADGAPALQRFDYVALSRRFDRFDMKYVDRSIRNGGTPSGAPNWYWQASDPAKVSFSLVAHPQPVPSEMVDPGETCLQVKSEAGEQRIGQIVFVGTSHVGESLESWWYGQFEPGKQYRLEAWLRQEGLGNGGAVRFGYGTAYPTIGQTFQVTGEWKKYTYDFVGPDRPAEPGLFGHSFSFTGPGTLWMDNCRIARVDRPDDAAKPYVPNATVLGELLKTQPETGIKGIHRSWFLARDATMSSILSWHATSLVSPGTSTTVAATMEMTLPMGLTFDLATGVDPQTRMRPLLVMQHILHTEEDWRHFVEYLAAPYDPQTDTPQTKPWAYLRTLQRGVATPWTDEFASITVEFGNETWHNGWTTDWLGFSMRNAVMQGGPEYGLFTRYLIGEIKKSPYWKSQNLDSKIRFDLGANYETRVEPDGTVRGYGEEAMRNNPEATLLGHANYVGPKWETGDYSDRHYDDHGVQECLLSYVSAVQDNQTKMSQGHDALVKLRPPYDIIAYEGGPGGFAIPSLSVPAEQVETNEKYGKSLAQAVGAFDCWMDSYRLGWTDQCYLGYAQGNYWKSHTTFANGFRPSPAWLALTLRNRVGSGDLMTVTVNQSPTLARKFKDKDQETVKDIPLVAAYAMRDASRWTVFVISRKLDGNHDGQDFGDGSSPVTLHLPFQKAAKITLTKLTGDPRLTNREKMNVETKTTDVPPDSLQAGTMPVSEKTGGVPGGLPAGSIFAYVFEGTE